jgi:DNA modification methylase
MKPITHSKYKILKGNCLNTLKSLEDCSVNTCITSPPYFGLRDYGTTDQIGLEDTPELFTSKLVEVFREVRRVLKQEGTLWLNLGDSYAGSGKGPAGNLKDNGERHLEHITKPYTDDTLKPKDLIGIPWRVAFALQADGWYLRQDIIWSKPNPMPESVTDRCTKAHEYIFLLSKSRKYYFDNESIKEPAHTTDKSNRNRDETKLNNTPGRTRMAGLKTNHYTTKNKRSVWNVSTKPYKGAHFATFPADLIKPCVLAGCPEGGTVLDPFGGSGTTAQVSLQNNRNAILCELNDDYIKLAEERIKKNTAQLQLL